MESKRQSIARETDRLLRLAISDDYAPKIYNAIVDRVIDDVIECADPDNWNEDDVRLAIGRVLLYPLTGYVA